MIPLVIGAILMFPLSGYFKRHYHWRDWVCRVAGIGVGLGSGYLCFAVFVTAALLGPAAGGLGSGFTQGLTEPTPAAPPRGETPKVPGPNFQRQAIPPPMNAGTPAVVVSKGLNLRSGPGADYQDIGDLRRCDRLDVIGEQGDWLEVEAFGVRAWVHGDYVSFDLSLCP
jgi:uncharacterized protein YgiM (DUF1202 family)